MLYHLGYMKTSCFHYLTNYKIEIFILYSLFMVTIRNIILVFAAQIYDLFFNKQGNES